MLTPTAGARFASYRPSWRERLLACSEFLSLRTESGCGCTLHSCSKTQPDPEQRVVAGMFGSHFWSCFLPQESSPHVFVPGQCLILGGSSFHWIHPKIPCPQRGLIGCAKDSRFVPPPVAKARSSFSLHRKSVLQSYGISTINLAPKSGNAWSLKAEKNEAIPFLQSGEASPSWVALFVKFDRCEPPLLMQKLFQKLPSSVAVVLRVLRLNLTRLMGSPT
jgi:hypothetical protein